MGDLSVWHWLIVAAVALLLFGYKKLPDASRSIGRSLRIFKSEMREFNEERSDSGSSASAATPAPPPALRTGTDRPAEAARPATTDRPAATADRPAAIADRPAAIADRPAATADRPAATADRPAEDRPAEDRPAE